MSNLITWFADHIINRHLDVRLRVHRAVLMSDPAQPECYFLNVVNGSPKRTVTVTHVWIETDASEVLVLARPLPAKIPPDEQWETWIPVDQVPPGTVVEQAGRAKLGDDSVICAEPRTDVPQAGYVPG